jgi:hypothetical protein
VTAWPKPPLAGFSVNVRLFRLRSVMSSMPSSSAQTPKPKLRSVPFLMVMGKALRTEVPVKKPIPTATVGPELPLPVRVNPFRSITTGPDMAVDTVIAGTTTLVDGEKVKFPVRTYVPGAVMEKGKYEIGIVEVFAACVVASCVLAACAAALIIRPSAAVRSILVG